MRTWIPIILLGFLFNTQNPAQHGTFHLELKAELYAYTSEEVRDYNTYSKETKLSPLPSFYLMLSKDLSESISLAIKPGILLIPDSFIGLELGFILNFKFYDKFYLPGGLNIHFITKNAEGNSYKTLSNSVYFLFIGAGYKITNSLSADISFHYALDEEYGYSSGVSPSDASGYSKIFNMIKLGFSYSYF